MDRTTAYTDGACIGNPGPGGWAWAIPDGAFAAGSDPRTTNQRMEIRAALEALRAIPGPLLIMSDSTYVVNCFRDRWWEGWLVKGWQTAAKKPVANRDLWEPLIALYRERGGGDNIEFRWVKGHSDDAMNDLVDRLAVEAARTQSSRAGEGPPKQVGSADVADDSAGGEVPAGYRILIGGERPPRLGGYGENPTATEVRQKLQEIIAAKRALHPDLLVMTGLGLGSEQLAARAALDSDVPYFAVLAFPNQDQVWPADSRQCYRALLQSAAGVTLLSEAQPAGRKAAATALNKRDEWMIRNADEAVIVWDGFNPVIGRQLDGLKRKLGEENLWVVDTPG